MSEWAIAGLTAASCRKVACSRVKEAGFSVECKLLETKEYESKFNPGKMSGVLAILEGVWFWAREDGINEDKNIMDPAVLRPMARMGGITYARVVDGIELPRPVYDEQGFKGDKEKLLRPKVDNQ